MIQCIDCKTIDLDITEHSAGSKCQCIIHNDMKTGAKPRHLFVVCKECKRKWAYIPKGWTLQEDELPEVEPNKPEKLF